LARAGTWDNGQGFIGVSNPTYGTLTFGRTQLLSQSALGTYDPVASVAFSQIGFTALYSTFGASPTSRINTAITYRLTYQSVRAAVQAQVGSNIRLRSEPISATSPSTRLPDMHLMR
jgi:predicted porin